MFKANNIDEYRATADMINGIVERVNGGQCAEYCKAEFFKEYPACLWLVGRDGEQVAIYALDAITDTDRRTAKQTHKAVFVTFQ